MIHLLQKKVRAVARRAMRVVLVCAVLQVVLGVLATGLLLGGADYLIRFQDTGLRWLSSLAWLAAVGWTWRRYLHPALQYRPTEVAIAQHIEQMLPSVQSDLASSIAFLSSTTDDASSGSPQLRRAVIEKTAVALGALEFNAVVSTRPAGRIAAVVCVFAAVVCIAAIGNPQAAVLAVQRLAAPWADLPWPRRHALEFENPPRRIAAGEPFEVQLHDRNGELPQRVEIQISPLHDDASDAPQEPSLFAMTLLDGKMVYRRTNVQRSFRYRAVGGDDDSMPWAPLQVVAPVNVESLRIEVRPPAYTGWPARRSDREITAISGSNIWLAGGVSRALSAASVVVESEEKREIALQLSDDRTRFSLSAESEPWLLESSGVYWLKLVDQNGVASGAEARWDLHATPDRAPTVSLETPVAAAYLTANGFLEVNAHCQDDLLLQAIELRYLLQGEEEEHVISLFAGPASAPALQSPQFDQVDQQAVRHRWSMESVSELSAGSELRFYLAARDYKPQEGRSAYQTVHIIAPEELQDRLANRQGEVLSGLFQALRMQREARSQTQSLDIQWNETKAITSSDVDQLRNAAFHQQRVKQEIAGESGGVAAKIDIVLAHLESSGVQNIEMKERFQKLRAKMQQLAESLLPQAEAEFLKGLESARKYQDARNSDVAKAFAETTQALRAAALAQDGVIVALEAAVEALQQWDRFQSLAREARQLQREQKELRRQTARRRLQTLAKSADELSSQQRVDLKKLAAKQHEAANRFQRLEDEMGRAAEQLRKQKKHAAETLDDALRASRRRAASAGVRESSRQIEENQLGKALAAQQNAEEALEEVLDILSHRREHELQRIVEGLAQAKQALDALKKRSQENTKSLAGEGDKKSSKSPENPTNEELHKAAEEQQHLAEQAEQLARQLKRLRAPLAAETLQHAANAAKQSRRAADEEHRQEALKAAQKVDSHLQETRAAVQQALEQARADHLQEQLQLLAVALESALPKQQQIVEAVRRIAHAAASKPTSRSAIASLAKWEDAQRSAWQEVEQQTSGLHLPKAFEFGLAGAVREMQRTESSLTRQEVKAGVEAAGRALERMESLRAAIRVHSESGRGSRANGENRENQPASEKKAEGALPSLAELRLLKQMQDSINQRTLALHAFRASNAAFTPDQKEELQQLAEEQSQLAEIVESFRAAVLESAPKTETLPEINDSELLPLNDLK